MVSKSKGLQSTRILYRSILETFQAIGEKVVVLKCLAVVRLLIIIFAWLQCF
jgi:hypothetical protein